MEIIELLQEAMENPWLFLFLSVWAAGYFLKEMTKVRNDYIPLIVLGLGIVLGLLLIEISIHGALIGGLMAVLQVGGYDVAKGGLRFLSGGVKNEKTY